MFNSSLFYTEAPTDTTGDGLNEAEVQDYLDAKGYVTSTVVAPVYATKQELNTGLSDKVTTTTFNSSYGSLNGQLQQKPDLQWVQGNYATKQELNTGLSDKVTTTTFNNLVGQKADTIDVQRNFATKQELTDGLSDKVTTTTFNSTYGTLNGQLQQKPDTLWVQGNFATKQELNATNTNVNNLNGQVQQKPDTLWVQGNYATKQELNAGLSDKITINQFIRPMSSQNLLVDATSNGAWNYGTYDHGTQANKVVLFIPDLSHGPLGTFFRFTFTTTYLLTLMQAGTEVEFINLCESIANLLFNVNVTVKAIVPANGENAVGLKPNGRCIVRHLGIFSGRQTIHIHGDLIDAPYLYSVI